MTAPARRGGWKGTPRASSLRLPPALMRPGIRQIGRRVLDPALAWEVQQTFNTWVTASSRTSVWESGCHSWYTTASGRNTNNWPDHTFMYRHRVRRFDLGRYRAMPKPPALAAPSVGRA